MSLFECEESPEIHAARLCALLVAGTKVLDHMFQNGESLTFYEWSTQLAETAMVNDTPISYAQRLWLWDSIRTEPTFKTRFGELSAATVPWTSKDQRFRVFNTGEQFEIRLKGATVSVKTEEPLDMKPGKKDRLECCNCKAIVTIRPKKAESVEREADIMGIRSDQITIRAGVLTVNVVSLNQAYTISSRRLESNRRVSHGGRTYDCVFHVSGMNRTLLEDIRRAVETGTWKTPPPLNVQPNKPASESSSGNASYSRNYCP